MNVQGKTALVTGASRGIGRAIAVELARHGVTRLVLIARNRQRLEDVANDVELLGCEAVVVPLDLTQPADVSVAIAQVWRNHGPIHLLVNCAGVAHQTAFLKSRLPQVQQEIAVNLIGMYTITRMVARRMVSQREGRIVNVSSLMGKVAAPTMATYSATKFAILGFTQALRSELAPYNVQVTALLPTLTDTDMVKELDRFQGIMPMTPQQVAKAFMHGLQTEAPEILVGWQSHLAAWINRAAPWLVEKIVYWAAPSSQANSSASGLHRHDPHPSGSPSAL